MHGISELEIIQNNTVGIIQKITKESNFILFSPQDSHRCIGYLLAKLSRKPHNTYPDPKCPITGGGMSCAIFRPPAFFMRLVSPPAISDLSCHPRRFFCVRVPHLHQTAIVLYRPWWFFKTAGGRKMSQDTVGAFI